MPKTPSFLDRFDQLEQAVRDVLVQLVAEEDVDDTVRDAREAFAAMEDEIPYADRPGHVMYWSSFAVFQSLATYQAASRRGIDIHAVGRAILAAPLRVRAQPLPPEAPEKMREDALASQEAAAPHEFVFEIVPGGADADWGMNITSCAVCHAFAKHDAMALVPYMCATDDKMSDAGEQGLRRTGTIALGADCCDFRFKAHGEPLRLAERYPDAIRSLAD
jgi:hypothetical protein